MLEEDQRLMTAVINSIAASAKEEKMMATTRKDIEAALWRGANTFRGAIDAANYKDYILPMLFCEISERHLFREGRKLKGKI